MKIIIKIGTAAIFDSKKQKIKTRIIKQLAKNISKLIKKDNEIIIISSGAVGCGKRFIKNNNAIGTKQAQASIGQIKLMETYSKIFTKYNLSIAQFLLNSNHLTNSQNIKNLKETYKYLKGNAIPIVNENDVTSIKELSLGDNDTLATKLLFTLNFDMLIILTEVGALIKNNRPLLKSNLFSEKDYDKMKLTSKGFGGLKTKLETAKKITTSNKKCIIANAKDSITRILSKKVPSTEFYL